MTKRSHVLPAITVSLLAIAATAALAADLPARSAPPVYIPPPLPVFTWTGFFLGGNAGVAFNDSQSQSTYFPTGSIAGSTGTSGVLTATGRNNTSFTGGGQIGYNYELGGAGLGGFGLGGGLVIGVVADAQYLDHGNTAKQYAFNAATPGNAFVRVPGLPATVITGTNTGGNDNFFGTVRGRAGIAFDRAMIYGTGGLAYDTRTTGYTYGGGIEYSITNNISIGAEYLRVNLNRSFTEGATYTAPARLGAGTLTVTSTGGRDQFNVARAVLNYKFTYPVAPVVARY